MIEVSGESALIILGLYLVRHYIAWYYQVVLLFFPPKYEAYNTHLVNTHWLIDFRFFPLNIYIYLYK